MKTRDLNVLKNAAKRLIDADIDEDNVGFMLKTAWNINDNIEDFYNNIKRENEVLRDGWERAKAHADELQEHIDELGKDMRRQQGTININEAIIQKQLILLEKIKGDITEEVGEG